MRFRAGLIVSMTAATVGCAAATPRLPPKNAPAELEVPLLDRLPWADLNAETFARARAEGRIVLIDGSADWCHWCHVMDATTYRDPEVRKLLSERFLPVRVDVDARPDFEERYRAWGWPATVLMTARAEEIGKYKGYIPPAKFLEVLRAVAKSPLPAPPTGSERATAMQPGPWTEEQLAEAGSRAQEALDARWDPREGSWGGEQDAPSAVDNAWALAQARRGDVEARRRALFTLGKQESIVEPALGGDGLHPQDEKRPGMQAGAISNYAAAYDLTGDARWLATAQHVRGLVDRSFKGPDGGLHGYGRDNALLIAAYVDLGQAAHDPTAIATAERTAARVAQTHATPLGGITHAGDGDARVLFLADNAAYGFALMRLYDATHAPAYLERANAIAAFMLHELQDPSGGFWASTPDPAAAGVFATRRRPFEENVMAIRFLARLSRYAPSEEFRMAIGKALAVVGTREAIESHGRTLGDLLLALEETKYLR